MMALSAFFDRVRRRLDVHEPEIPLEDPEDAFFAVDPIRVILSPINGDETGDSLTHLIDRLDGRLGLEIIHADRPLSPPGADNDVPSALALHMEVGERWLARDNADLLIWGDVTPQNLWRLRFLPRTTAIQPHAASLSVIDRLDVPPFFDEAYGDFVFACALAAANMETTVAIRARAALFEPALATAQNLAEGAISGTVQQGASATSCYASLLLLQGCRTGDLQTLEKAVQVFRSALLAGGDAFLPHEEAIIGMHIADAMGVLNDLTGTPKLIERQVEYYRRAADAVQKDFFAPTHAMLKLKLGLSLHDLALETGDADLFAEAGQALQDAGRIWSPGEDAARWADVQNSYGGLLLSRGRLTKDAHLFDEAISVFMRVTDVWPRRTAPLIWATTVANLGIALKEKGLASQRKEALVQAADTMEKAGTVLVELNLDGSADLVFEERDRIEELIDEQAAAS